MSKGGRLFAEKFFLLSEIAIIDVKDSDTTNVFKILKHPDTLILRCDTLEEKRGFLMLIKKTSDDLISSRKKDFSTPKEVEIVTAVSTSVSSLAPAEYKPLVESKKIETLDARQIKFLTELPIELDVLIAHREFQEAVRSCENALEIFPEMSADISTHVTMKNAILAKIKVLSDVLCRDLTLKISIKQTEERISMLLRLGLGDLARDIYLTSRTKVIRARIRQLVFTGDVVTYICDLSETVFRLLRNTTEWYGSVFREQTMASGFMKWIELEIENFGCIVRRLVFEDGFDGVGTCMEVARFHSSKVFLINLAKKCRFGSWVCFGKDVFKRY